MKKNWSYEASRKRWRLRYLEDNIDKSFYSSMPQERKARQICELALASWLSNEKVNLNKITVRQAFIKFLEHYEVRVKPTSYNRMDATGKAHLKHLNKRNLSDIKRSDWQDIIDRAYKNGAKSSATLKGIGSAITQLCKFCAAKGWINDYDVPVYFLKPAEAKKKEKKILQPDEVAKLFAPSENWYIHAFRFILLTGIRRGEFCALQLERDFDGQIIHIQESLSHEGILTDGKTKQANRYLALSSLALRELNSHLAKREILGLKSPYLFCTQEGNRIPARRIQYEWQKWREENGIDITVHELRHTHISYMVGKSDENLIDLKLVFGHSKKMDTEGVYVHEINKNEKEQEETLLKLKRLASKIDGIFEQKN